MVKYLETSQKKRIKMKKTKVDFEQDDHIQTTSFFLKQIIEKRNATNQEAHLLFVDFTKA